VASLHAVAGYIVFARIPAFDSGPVVAFMSAVMILQSSLMVIVAGVTVVFYGFGGILPLFLIYFYIN
jgi:hypothetical protein